MNDTVDKLLQEWAEWWRFSTKIDSRFLQIQSPSFFRLNRTYYTGGGWSEKRYIYFENLSQIISNLPVKHNKIIKVHYLNVLPIEYKITEAGYPKSTYYRLLGDAHKIIANQMNIQAA
ncbi:MAG: hypothetical protein IJM09_03780 [Neisseriaceae bacterium]|nr:hypothetical protein [Neisseriaceae bacterium]